MENEMSEPTYVLQEDGVTVEKEISQPAIKTTLTINQIEKEIAEIEQGIVANQTQISFFQNQLSQKQSELAELINLGAQRIPE